MNNAFTKFLSEQGFVTGDHPVMPDSNQPAATADRPIPSPASTPWMPPAATSSIGLMMLGPDDQKRLQDMEKQIYSVPSAYVPFRDLRAAMGGSNDIPTVMKMLQAAQPGISPDKIKASIDSHLGAIDKIRSDFTKSSAAMIATDITAQMQHAGELQTQIAKMTQEMLACQQHAAQAKQKVDEGTAHFNAVIQALQAPLTEAKQLLGVVNG